MIARLATLVLAATLLAPAFVSAAVYVGVAPDGIASYTDAPSKPGFRPLFAFGLPPDADLAHGQYAELIERAAAEHGVDPTLVRAIIRVESNFQAHALSRKGARGLMQLMPATASRFAVGNAFDPAENVRGGVKYLRALLDLFPDDLASALAGYNAGEHAVQRHKGVPPYAETRDYVARVLRQYRAAGGSRAVAAAVPAGRRPEAGLAAAKAIYRSVEADGTPRFTDLAPLIRHADQPQ